MISKANLINDFLSYAIEHGKAISSGDYVKANKFHKKLHNLFTIAKKENLIIIYKECLNYNNDDVRLWAATFLLKTSPDIAEKCLQELTGLKTITGLSAKTTLDMWKKGLLNLL
jgi:dihydrodipicolinate synthase/N-acetylneuraminate lyase